MRNYILSILFLLTLSGCGPGLQIDQSISDFRDVKEKVSLGDSKQKFLYTVYPSQLDLGSEYKKDPERYIKEGVKVEIYFMRSSRQPDDLTTDDEFTPYLFNDKILVGIGWTVLGGLSTQGQSSSDVYISNTNKTIIY